MTRMPEQPGERIQRSRTISFSFDGKRVEALEGDTIASALFVAGRRTFSRSFKYHRRRGLLCCAGQCPNCIVAVDGAPGIRACTESVREGMAVEHLNARPGLEFDLMRVTDLVGGPLTPPGFYYKTFIRPRRLWPLYEKVLRHAAGLGRLPKHQAERTWRTEYRRRHADVLVVGGGEAGLHAAIEAAELGGDVVMADDGPAPGGRMLSEGRHEEAAALTERARGAGVEILVSAPVLGFFDGLAPIWQGSTLHQVRARAHVFATGSVEQPLMFAGNDLPGVMLSGAVRRLLALYAVCPGTRAVIATTSERGLDAAQALARAGVEIAAVADLREGTTVIEARGRKHLDSVVLGPLDAGPRRHTVRCDLLVVDGGSAPAVSLVLQAGGEAAYDAGRGHFAIDRLPPGIFAAGDLDAHGAGEAAAISGGLTGRRAAAHAGGRNAAGIADEDPGTPMTRDSGPIAVQAGWPPHGKRKCFACLCEDVTAKDIARTVAEGYDSIELAKRYSTLFMGPCQGRMCQLPGARLLAAETGERLEDVGLTTARPPWSTVPLGVLAGRPFEPAKRSALHHRHRELGATVMWAGDWRRAYDYGDPDGEALAVQQGAGLIDVSTLGKLIVRGPDAGTFLDRMYPNRFSDLKPGRIRYGVLTSDSGRIMDDGTVCRLDDQTFYVTTTSSGAGAVEQWFSWWLAEWRMEVTLTDVTQGLAAINLAGPQARTVLGELTKLECGPQEFKYLDARQAEVADVPCLLLRIGFVGELGYEIHCPAPQAASLWDAIIGGAGGSVRPFGLEPQRILRLQKLHILVGQDSDSESTPLAAGMPWIVKLDKPEDFIGRWALEHAAEHPAQTVLVGFTTAGRRVPTEGSVVVHQQRPAGQVTSARFSPLLGRVIGIAWVPAALAQDDARIEISDRNERIAASVTTRPFYDPDGAVLRS